MKFVDKANDQLVKVNSKIDEDGNYVILIEDIPLMYLDHISGRLMLIPIRSYESLEHLRNLGIDFSTNYISINAL
jgi:hypothetical protein